ncbi:alpha/beta hydrolase [Patescibacteria group bacterium]|nr:alpha/beta hydrolase [Patescibacteria group bacterium]
MQKKFSIKNRRGLTIRGIIDWKGKSYGPLIILCHGLFGFVEKPNIKKVAKALVKTGYAVVRFDATNNVGKSQGRFEKFTVGGYIQDTKQVISYALKKLRTKEYSVVGFSIGAMPAYVIAANDKRMKHMVLQGPTYDLKYELERENNFLKLKEKGWAFKYSVGLKKNIKVGYELYREGIKYKVDPYLKKVGCPTLVVYGSKEHPGTQKNFRELYRQLKTKKKRIILPNAPHTLVSNKNVGMFTEKSIKWLKAN